MSDLTPISLTLSRDDVTGIYYNAKGKRVCGNKCADGVSICGSPLLYPNFKCRKHGGPNSRLAGIASPTYKHGRLSKFLPKNLRSRYNVAVNDDNLLALTDEIAALQAREEELFASLSRQDGPTTAEQLFKIWEELTAARDSRDTAGMQTAMQQIGALIQEGAAEQLKWRDIVKLFHDKRALVESERRRQVELRQMVAIDEIMLFLRAVLHTVRQGVLDNVRDPQDARNALIYISRETTKLLNKRGADADAPADMGGADDGALSRSPA